ncbi:PREDICTED: dysferlin-like [Acropora digitifera]|uniref:dysferlin-like n=1 Tax=Acropora digitifera TaxID=70779 RepID=UPI00077B1A3B|nr:PREDICTED: dysferlin-like [Acropora digitifera]
MEGGEAPPPAPPQAPPPAAPPAEAPPAKIPLSPPAERAATPEPGRSKSPPVKPKDEKKQAKDEKKAAKDTKKQDPEPAAAPSVTSERPSEKVSGTGDVLARSEGRKKLPDKNLDFQVRVRIIEGRQLAGANISPVVRVTIDNQTRQTKVIKSTNRPFYDEVFNSRRLRANAMVGSFQCDVGFFYDEPSHAVIRKWILLSDPEDKMAGAKGYLKVTVMVLGPGDEAPTATASADEDDLDDIEEQLAHAGRQSNRQTQPDNREDSSRVPHKLVVFKKMWDTASCKCFLPSFGPCFVNFYGSTREYSALPNQYDELNLGMGEGVAYRGRALIELQTKLDTQPEKLADDILNDDIIHIQPYLRRRKYKLFACFLEATLVACTDGPVTFEISIGNYGNQLDESVPPSASSTSPTNAVFDGCFYYFLPWNDIKPCCNVDSHWEDIAFRLEPLNILSRMCEQLHGNGVTSKDELEAPDGWAWTSEWSVDTNRAVDEDGWEYTVDPSVSSYVAVEKTYHLSRRRRWVRGRNLVKSADKEDKSHEENMDKEGWEYAALFSSKFHSKSRTRDMVRRRRWHRKMVQTDATAPAVFQIGGEGKQGTMMVPRMYVTFQRAHKFQLRVYLYRTLCPIWDQTIIFENVFIYGSPEITEKSPPQVVIEVFDEDPVGRDDFMGRCVESPSVKLKGHGPPAPKLLWEPVTKGSDDAGEILAAFELFLDEENDLPYFPSTKENKTSVYVVPSGIRPAVQRTAIEVLCWGVRNMKKYQLANVSSPSVELECGGRVVQSCVIKNTQKNPNFGEPIFFFDTYLPKEELYTPPVNIKVRDNRSFGRRPIVGVHCIKSLHAYSCSPLDHVDYGDDTDIPLKGGDSGSFIIDVSDEMEKTEQVEEDIDWWSKFYASLGDYDKCGDYMNRGYDKLMVYDTILENIDVFEGFQDLVKTFELYRGKVKPGEEATVVGEFKGSFHIYPLPSDPTVPLPPRILTNLPPSDPVECLVRVYIIRAIDLQPMDANGLVKRIAGWFWPPSDDNKGLIQIASECVFFYDRMFELTAIIPITKDLTITVMDYDFIGKDDKIGETVIDLENRFLSKFGAMCGLPQSYCTSGINKWRDSRTPKQILEKYCETNKYMKPRFIGNNKVIFNGDQYLLEDFENDVIINPHMGPPDQRLALHVLNSFPLVPEHVETRPLFNSLQPGVEQGKLQMWVDIFPNSFGPPGMPFNVSPREPAEYQLRIIIWNTSDVILDDVSITGEAMSDIYVKGYCAHFWSLDIKEHRVPPKFIAQIWDNDLFSPDDFLGKDVIYLLYDDSLKLFDIIKWTCVLKAHEATVTVCDNEFYSEGNKCFFITFQGKLEMTLELLSKQEVEENPAGQGREEPNQNPTLDPPNRPATSFGWFSSPFKSLRYILWRRFRCKIIAFLVIVILLVLVAIFFYSMPVSFHFHLLMLLYCHRL